VIIPNFDTEGTEIARYMREKHMHLLKQQRNIQGISHILYQPWISFNMAIERWIKGSTRMHKISIV